MAKPSSTKTALASRSGSMTTETKTPYDVLSEYKALRYDYGLVSEQHRRAVQDAAVDIRRRQQRARQDMFAVGRRLLEVKDYLPHGEFERWIRAEFDIEERGAQRMMGAARAYPDEAKATRVSLLSDRSIYMLSAPSTPQEARDEVERLLAATGKPPTSTDIERIIAEAKATRVSLLRDEIRAELGGSVEREPAPRRMIEMQAETPASTPSSPAPLVPLVSAIGADNQRKNGAGDEGNGDDEWRDIHGRTRHESSVTPFPAPMAGNGGQNVSWLLHTPAHDINFELTIGRATIEDLREALAKLPDVGVKVKREKIEARLRRLEREKQIERQREKEQSQQSSPEPEPLDQTVADLVSPGVIAGQLISTIHFATADQLRAAIIQVSPDLKGRRKLLEEALQRLELLPNQLINTSATVAGVADSQTIDAEYAIVAPDPFDAWLAAMPADLGLREYLAVLALAKKLALDAKEQHKSLHNSVYNALPTWSSLIREVEKLLK